MALFMCNTSNVHEMKFGRPQTVLLDKEMPNGAIVTLGATQEAKDASLDHAHAVTEGALTSVVGAFVIVAPEINVQQYRMIDGQIGKFVVEADETYSAYMLQKLYRLEYSDAYFMNAGANGERFVKHDSGCLRIVSIHDLWLPVMLQANVATAQGSNNPAKLMPASCKMIKIEVEK